MKRALAVIALLGLAALTMAARPGTEFDLLTRLNGQPARWVLPDAGRSILSASSGKACATLSGTDQRGASFTPTVVLLMPETPMNVCIKPSVSPNGVTQPWDGGCNTIVGDENYGVAIQPFVPYYFVPQSAATAVCAASDGGTVQGALYDMR